MHTSSTVSGIIERDGFGLRYHIEGKGLPTVVIGSAIYYPRTFSEKIRQHLRLACFDHRCFAIPPKNNSQYSQKIALDALLDDIEAMRKLLDLGQIVIMAHSGNGYIALEYAKRYQENVSHVVMIGTSPDLSAKNQEICDRYWERLACAGRKKALGDSLSKLTPEYLAKLSTGRQFIQQYIHSGPKVWFDYAYDATPLWHEVDLNMPLFHHFWGTVFRDIDIQKGMGSFKKPIFLALGRYDFLVDPSSWDAILKKYPSFTSHIFERSGHTSQIEEHHLFDERLLHWLSLY